MRISQLKTEGKSPHKKGTAKYKKHMAAMHAEGYKVMPPMDSKYVERDGLEGPFTALSGKVVYYDPKEGKYYDPDTDIYMSYNEWNTHNSDHSGMSESKSEKRWKQTSMSPEDAIRIWGKKNVQVTPGGLNNGDDMVEVFVESMNEGTKGCADCEWIKAETDGDIDTCDECAAEKRKTKNESLELSEFGPAERYIRTGNTITYANSKTGSVRSNLNLGGDKNVRVNNHFNADGSQGQVTATGTVGGMKFKATNQANGAKPAASVNGVNIPLKASKKVREYVQEPTPGKEDKFTEQEIKFVHELCLRHDGVERDPAGLKYLGKSELWDGGNIIYDKVALAKLMAWVEENKLDIQSRFKNMFRVYDNDQNRDPGSDGDKVLRNINSKINASKKVREETEYSDKQIKMAFGILNDPRYRDGNYSGAYATIEKVAKGLARHPSVRNALRRANESVNKYK